MATQKISTLTVENQTFYDRTLLERLLPELHFYRDADKKVIPKGKGTSIEFRKFNSLSIPQNSLSEGVTPSGSSLSITYITATAVQEGDFVEVSDVLDLVSKDPVITETSELLGEQSGQTVDIRIRDVVTAGTTVQYANGRAAQASIVATDVLTGREVRLAKARLKKNNVKPFEDGCYHLIIDAEQEFDFKSDTASTGFVEVSKYAQAEKLLDGEIGRYDGVRIMVSSNIEAVTVGSGSSAVKVHKAVIYGKHAYAVTSVEKGEGKASIIVKALGSSGTADPLNQRATIGWKMFFVAKRLNELAIVRIETGATEL